MIAVQLANIRLVLGARTIFDGLSWEIQHDQKIGLIGPNGVGKSSLFKLITGEYQAEPGGSVTRARGLSLGYLPQQPEFDPGQTALELALTALPRLAEIECELEQVETSLGEPDVYEDPKRLGRALERQQRLLEEFASLEGATYTERVRQMLLGLGLPETDLDKPLELLSGGQKKLAGLARLILSNPDLLLLDEADNHLDLPGKVYLERLIREYPGAVALISHDRYLLDACVTHITELEDGKLFTYEGDYSGYMVEKDLRLARQEELYQAQQKELNRLADSIKRLALWGKIYDNEKFSKRAAAMQKRMDRIERIDAPTLERKRMDLRLGGWRGSTKVLELRGVCKAYGRRPLFERLDHIIQHGERVGLIGPNGSGKSVFLRMLLGEEQPDRGEIILGPSVKIGYYAQEHENLDPSQTLIEAVRFTAPLSEERAVAFLRRYLFGYRQASQYISELSGGERSRLQLALLVLSGANFLLLDEPTNNLDIASAEVLEEALVDFVGTVLVISHDRYFLDRTVQRLLVAGSGELQAFAGSYTDYLAAGIPQTATVPSVEPVTRRVPSGVNARRRIEP
jgi:ATP-binding cassette, subfamily F, member 3